ncbi:DUF4956 domain-containing protein [Agromyces atrinae]|uniref:DUF4956 domain-containing protein n=1 Tax=Agromyces atrinae TaxID=592376 RepID=A0A4Q2M1L8_9MICO|nr:DUF4956 domain-containing protein [Agromyces atrinae]NYD68331.1 hypothetical protein [Agromyces atrinae]RXZ85618.1 DUF4956 domain-containing protein [Agromyces atrinae]
MDIALIIGADLLAIGVLVFGIYFPRHRRRDLVVAFLGVNVGVLAVALVLGSTAVGAGLGLGLFGVLSIIRLRSREIEQGEVAYYFAALALGLIGGLGGFTWLGAGLMALIVAVLFVADHPSLFRRYRQQTIVVDHAVLDEEELRGQVERLLGARVHALTVVSLDLVNDTTTVDARFELTRPGRPGARAAGIRSAHTAPVTLEPAR